MFTIDCSTLCDLVEHRNDGSVAKLHEVHGGVKGVAEKLKVSLKDGLGEDPLDKKNRMETYGSNVLSLRPPLSFCELLFDALQDVTIIILIGILSFISLPSIYKNILEPSN
jgi:Ca2+ transporting ATPase